MSKITEQRKIQISTPVMGEDEWQAMRGPIFSGWLTSGPKVKEFETLFSEIHGVKESIAVTSATTALHMALVALGVGPGDEIIVPAFTWISTANVILYCGATPVFVDIDTETFNISLKDLAKKITSKTKVIIPVHLFGLCADIDEIKNIAKGIKIVEDGACAAGSMYKGKFAGSLGDIGCFSFHPRKSVTTGEGGMCTTNDSEIAEKLRCLRNHGASLSEEERHHGPQPFILPEFNVLGFNYRMTDLQGALGVVQIKKLLSFIEERDRFAAIYEAGLKNIPWIRTPKVPQNYKHGWQSYVLYIDPEKAPRPRNEMMQQLHTNGIATRPGTHAVHMLSYYKEKYGIKPTDFPGAMLANNQSMSIPLHNNMTLDDFEYIIENIHSL